MLLKVLSDAEVEVLHAKTLEALENPGVKISHAEALEKMKRAGAKVEETSGRVRMPAGLVKELLAQAPGTVYQTGLNGKVLEAGGRNRYYLSLITDPFICDRAEGPRRPVLEDIRRHTILGESLDRISSMMRMQYPAADVPEPDSYWKTMEMFLCHHTKHTHAYPTSEENGREWIEVMEVIAEAGGVNRKGPAMLTLAMAVTSPLHVTGMNVEIIKMAMEHGCPIVSTVCPMAGTTAPYSIAGTALIANAEALLAVLIGQLYKPGHPVFYAVGPSVTDMKTGHDLYYRAEKMKFKIIGNQMGRFYGLPIAGEAGGTMTWRADVQNGMEGICYLLASLTGGQNIIGGVGSMHNANGMSAEQIVMQCGMIDMAEFLAAGVDLSERKLAIESIRQAGPGGNFLCDDLTMELLRGDEFFESEHMDFSGGYHGPGTSLLEKAKEKAERLIENYKPAISEKVREVVRTYFKDKYTSETWIDYGW